MERPARAPFDAVEPVPPLLESLARSLQALEERPRSVLVADDEPLILKSLCRVLSRRGLVVRSAASGVEAWRMLEEGPAPDILVTDQRMPGMTGVQLLDRVRRRFPDVVRVCMSGYAERDEIVSAINSGAVFRFLLKPWTAEELDATIEVAVREADDRKEMHAMRAHLFAENRRLQAVRDALEAAVQARDEELSSERARVDDLLIHAVRALAASVEAKDRYTAGHSELVSRFAVALGRRIGLATHEIEALRLGGVLHDVGKIGVPDAVLLKPGRLSQEELVAMKAHAEIGARIVEGIRFPFDVLPIVRSHHERWDGKGYPDGTAGTDTPLLARVTHVVDVYEAVTARRVYRDPMPKERVVALFAEGAGADFDPDLVPPFLELLEGGALDAIRAEARLDVAQGPQRFAEAQAVAFERRVD